MPFFSPGNWIADKNRFTLGEPPSWWLRALYDFDPLLVVIPSRQYPIYILARRARTNPVLEQHEQMNPDRDIRMLASYKLVHVTTLEGKGLDKSAAFCTWHTGIFNELRRRDITRQGGWEKYVKTLEEFEQREREQALANIQTQERELDKDGYRHLKRRVGERISTSGPARVAHPTHSGSTAGSGL